LLRVDPEFSVSGVEKHEPLMTLEFLLDLVRSLVNREQESVAESDFGCHDRLLPERATIAAYAASGTARARASA
jgi:hypothetical protein